VIFSTRQHLAICLVRYMLLAVRMSVRRVDHTKTVEAWMMQFSPYSSPIPLVFAQKVSSKNSKGFPWAGVSNKGEVG